MKNTNLASLFCLFHSSMNTFLCNLAFLHVLCSSLDTFFRLRNPRLYLDSQRPQTTFLKVSAPWIVTTIQAACQLTINSQKTVTIKNSLCLINDGNFLILRSVISYAVPLVVCVILIILQIIYLRLLTSVSVVNLEFLLRSYSVHKITDKCVSDEAYQMNDMENSQSNNEVNEDEEMIPDPQVMDTSISLETVNPILNSPKLMSGSTSRILKHNCPKHGLISFPVVIQESSQILDLTSTSNLLTMSNSDQPKTSLHKSVSFEMPDITNLAKSVETIAEIPNYKDASRYSSNKKAWLKMYKIEQLSIAMNMIMCIISIGVWSPLILSTLAYKLCEESPCTIHILVDRINDFEWWAFAGGLAYPCIFLFIDSTIRKSLKSYMCAHR